MSSALATPLKETAWRSADARTTQRTSAPNQDDRPLATLETDQLQALTATFAPVAALANTVFTFYFNNER